MAPAADLLLFNANVVTLDRDRPRAQAVAVCGDVIVGVGSLAEQGRLRGPGARRIDCQGMTLLPGLVDAHCHLLALAASLAGVDCRPNAVCSIEKLQEAIQLRAQQTPPGRWVRGFGYDDLALAEGRHPTSADLDPAAQGHPVRLDHRSGHAAVLNSHALALAGINGSTPDPPEGFIERDAATGQPTGLLLEMGGWLRARLGQLRDAGELEEGVRRMDRTLLSYGITSAQDAGPDNDMARWEAFRALKDSGRLRCRVTMLVGIRHLPQFQAAGQAFGGGDDGPRLGHAKLMVTLTTGQLHPPIRELRRLVAQAHWAGFPVAIHAVEQEAVAAAADVLQASRWRPWDISDPYDRIEHCAECPPEVLRRLGGIAVVTQPGFIYWNGDAYLQRVPRGVLPYLYPIGALRRAYLRPAFGSDAPVVDPNPWPAIYSAVTRQTQSGQRLPAFDSVCRDQDMSATEALRAYTLGGAQAEGTQGRKGSIKPGKLADLILLDGDPTRMDIAQVKDLRVVMTLVGGQVVWDG